MKRRLLANILLTLSLLAGSALATTGGEDDKADSQKEKKPKKGLPLKGSRKIAFNTDEGSWMSLDVSPDGRQIVFDLLGDLYLLPFEGGRPERLTQGLAFDAQPRFSPDGTEVVYTSDKSGGENLWVITLEGRLERQITKGKNSRFQSPEWTPDGDFIVASKGGLRTRNQIKLWIFHKDGGSGAPLVKEPTNLKMTGAAFGQDGRYVWHSRRRGDWEYNAMFPQYQLAIYDRETGKDYARSSRYGSAFAPQISPDGKWLVYGTRHEAETGLRIRDLESGEERWLAYPVQHDDMESRGTRDVFPGMSFTPDSREIVTTYGGKIMRIPVDGGQARAIEFQLDVELEAGPLVEFDYPIEDSPEFLVRQIRDTVPSPQSDRLAFTALDSLYVADFPGGEPRRATALSAIEAYPTFSPDGRWIAFVVWADDGGHLYKVPASGGTPRRVSDRPALYNQPAFSPDGTRIVAVRTTARDFRASYGPIPFRGDAELVWFPSEGGKATVITPLENRGAPHFTSKSDRIYLYDRREGLVSIRWDGSDEKKHLKVTGKKVPGAKEAPQANLILISPDGLHALAQSNNDLYVVRVPYVGGETPTVSVANPKEAAFPVVRLTDIGGQFPAWNADSNRVHWSIGNAHFVYDLKVARRMALARSDQSEKESDQDEEADDPKSESYKPDEHVIKIMSRRDIPRGTVVLRGARVISMKGDQVIENSDIVVRNNRIVSVGRRGEVPSGARMIDISGKTVIPGLVDTHAHMRPAWGIHKTQVWSYLANLAFGVTTTRDPQTGTTDVLTYADRVEGGTIMGPRIYSTGPGVFFGEQIRDLDHARNVLKRYSRYYDTKTIKMYVAGNRQQRQWIIMAAREQKLMPTTEGSLDLKLNLTQVIDGYPGHEHSFPVFPLYKDVVQLMAQVKTNYTPTLLVAYGGPWAENYYYTRENPHDNPKLRRFTPHEEIDRKTRRRGQGGGRPGPGGWFLKEEHVFTRLAKFVKDLIEAGGRAGVGSHGQLQGLGYHWELWAIQSGGLSTHDALRMATIIGATAIGLDSDVGSIEEGKLADLVILDANPLDDIRNTNTVRWVMKNGRLYQADSLKEVWPREKELGALPWQGHEPAVENGVEQR